MAFFAGGAGAGESTAESFALSADSGDGSAHCRSPGLSDAEFEESNGDWCGLSADSGESSAAAPWPAWSTWVFTWIGLTLSRSSMPSLAVAAPAVSPATRAAALAPAMIRHGRLMCMTSSSVFVCLSLQPRPRR